MIEKRGPGRPRKVITTPHSRLNYFVPLSTRIKFDAIAEKLGQTGTETFVKLIEEEYNKLQVNDVSHE